MQKNPTSLIWKRVITTIYLKFKKYEKLCRYYYIQIYDLYFFNNFSTILLFLSLPSGWKITFILKFWNKSLLYFSLVIVRFVSGVKFQRYKSKSLVGLREERAIVLNIARVFHVLKGFPMNVKGSGNPNSLSTLFNFLNYS